MGTLSSLDILVVEDNASVRRAITFLLKRAGYAVDCAHNGEEALTRLEERYFDLVITDFRMAEVDGLELLRHIKERWPATEVIIITAFGTISRGVDAIRLGAFDFITKPFDNKELLNIVERFVEHRKAEQRRESTSKQLRDYAEFSEIIGQSPRLLELMQLVARIAPKESTCLVYGESGTGKELVAKAIHALSMRKDKPFVAINCGAIPETLLESELFGHVKGAFTNANFDKPGLFEIADGGTVFLDEIAEMPPAMQVKLLRCLQENEIRRIGEGFVRKVDFRLIAATNRNLEHEVKEGTFRQDLYYRINVIPVKVPALRERREDVPLLVRHFIRKYNARNNSKVKQASKRTISMLMNHDWPGNVRELENVIHRGVALSPNDEITPELLPHEIYRCYETGSDDGARKSGNLAEIEKEVILETLKKMKGNKKKTAQELGISKTTLWRRLKD